MMAVPKEPEGAAAKADHFFWQSGDLAQALQQINQSSVSIQSITVLRSICLT
jgi:hypothetical protein